ncbi:hypothetical protein B0T26DRAFT_33053 [Lasiosphaeria miniovina]|uniref:Uncharacterized protein n=1 Tax=Lasiosphaeria miniovina TaxID=1954250 RepID=A0AA40BGU5_9PEZI|nr:uncharacterized protein B0T26DRAFT_33053 [Lasiosphaeria miniovina]KAK0733703.1 hypothetical protein B0T26DRAFT_33053 [Lasiosphaeria miniovina]
MDDVSPLSPSLLTICPIASESTRQPTYTTVGSIYNPHATTPLQPPTRRPRSRRYPGAIQSPSGEPVFGFPNSLLSALPVADRAPSSPAQANQLPQYSPLQQNYDRAVSPVTEQKIALLAGRGMSAPSIRSGNLPPPPSYGLGISLVERQESTVVSNGDSAHTEDSFPPMRITVKGLNSLASYPNPAQKAAQQALAKATRTGNSGISRSEANSSISYLTSEFGGRGRVAGTFGSTISSAGIPQPLTAGPPGQRQFRPSALEGSVKALYFDQDTPSDFSTSFDPGYKQNSASNAVFSNTFNHLSTGGHGELVRGTDQSVVMTHQTGFHSSHVAHLTVNTKPLSTSSIHPDAVDSKNTSDTLPFEKAQAYYPQGFPLDYTRHYTPVDEFWHENPPAQVTRIYQQSTESTSERKDRINRNFYAGTEGLVKDMEGVMHDHDRRFLDNKVGVIGQGRERFRTMGSNGKVQPPFLTVAESNSIEDRAHAEPLLNMAFATLLTYKKERESDAHGKRDWRSGFVAADPAWIDNSEEGNKSFFDTPKSEAPEKKVVKKSRRGY